MPESLVDTCIDWTSFWIKGFFKQSATLNHLLPTNHEQLAVKDLSHSRLSIFWDWWPAHEHWEKNVQTEIIYVKSILSIIVGIDSLLSSISAFSTKKKFKLHTIHSGISDQMKPLKLVGQAAEIKSESKFEPLQVIWISLPKAIPEDNRRFWLQSSVDRALAPLGRVWRASTNTGRFQAAAVAAGSDWLARGKSVTTLVILT